MLGAGNQHLGTDLGFPGMPPGYHQIALGEEMEEISPAAIPNPCHPTIASQI